MCKNVVTRVYTIIDTKIRLTNKQTVYWITLHGFNNIECEDDFQNHCPRPICEHLHATSVNTNVKVIEAKRSEGNASIMMFSSISKRSEHVR